MYHFDNLVVNSYFTGVKMLELFVFLCSKKDFNHLNIKLMVIQFPSDLLTTCIIFCKCALWQSKGIQRSTSLCLLGLSGCYLLDIQALWIHKMGKNLCVMLT